MNNRVIIRIFGILLLFGFLGFFIFSSFLESNHISVKDSFASILTGLSQYSISEDTIPPTIVISSPIDGETIIGGDGTSFVATFILDGTGTEPNYAVISVDGSPVAVWDYAYISSSCAMVGGDPTIRTCNVAVTVNRGVHGFMVETADGGETPGGNTAVSTITVKVNSFEGCGAIISGNAILIENLDCSGFWGDALTIGAGGSLDCNDYTISGSGVGSYNGVFSEGVADFYIRNCIINNFGGSGLFFRSAGPNVIVTENDLTTNGVGITFSDYLGPLIVYHNNIYDNINYGIFGNMPLEASNLGEGNYWGRTDGCPSFILGLDSNRVDIIDSYSYYQLDGWESGSPDCDECASDPLKTHPGICGCENSDDLFGLPCVSDPNACGETIPGTTDCFGVCGAITPVPLDSDSDGTPDCIDICFEDPLKTDLGICGCGTPDTDTDNDGIADCMEECDDDPAKTEPGICGCGFSDAFYGLYCESAPNVCGEFNVGSTDCDGVCDAITPDATDSDSDGTADCLDGCPADPLKTAPEICGCGVADTDTDSDGAPDCIDNCDLDPLKAEPGICGCGVSDVDSDSDGTADCNDLCIADPLKIAPGICGCGTPDTDTDLDGTPDCNDLCSSDPAKIAPGVCGCGTPDTDTDLDGVVDCIDNCDTDPGKTDPGICGCGVSDVDSDSDGTSDCNDECPADPAKIAPGICGCGVADTDSDGDGTADCIDGCPIDPLKIVPGVCGCGVADTDSDGDGAPDCIDICLGFDDFLDNDGDGTPDGCDACPLDSENDADGDGICGDVDSCPYDVDNDADGDGICGDVDNCPTVFNPSQTDLDGDSLGEECDCDNVITGDLTLSTDKTCDGNGFVFGVDSATLDCAGHSISVNGGDYGIYTDGYSSVGVKNCEIIGGSIGVHVYSSDGATLEDNIVRGSYNQGILIEATSSIESDHIIIGNTLSENCNSGSNNCGAIQLYREDNCRIEDNGISDSYSHGILLVDSNNNEVLSNTISDCGWAGIIATSPIDSAIGGYNTISGNTITNCAPGTAVKTTGNSITNNEITSSEGGNYGIDLRSGMIYPENTYLFGNEVSGFTYGLHVWPGITSFTASGENYHDNYDGVHLTGAGAEGVRPLIENSVISGSDNCAISLASSSYLDLNSPTLANILSRGLCVDWSSKAYVTGGIFEGADSWGRYPAIYDVAPLYVSWTLNSGEASCKNSDVLYNGDFIFNRGAELELQNCELNINGEVVSDYDGTMTSFDKLDASITADTESSTIFSNADLTLAVTTSGDTTATLTAAAFSPSLPLEGSINLKGAIVEIDDYTGSISTSRSLKISYDDFELEEKDIDEETLKIYRYDSGSGEWAIELDQEVNLVGNYVSANFAEPGLFGIFGSEDTTNGEEEEGDEEETNGGGATGGAAYGTYNVNEAQLLAGYEKSLTDGGGLRFNQAGAPHFVKIMGFYPGGAILLIASTPQNVSFLIGDEKKFDFNEDGIYDLSVKLNSVNEEKKLANITILGISEKVVATEKETPSSEIGGVIGEELSARIYELKKLVSLLIILVLLVAIVLIAWAIASTICREKRSVSTGSDFTAADARLFVKRAIIRGYSKAEIRRMFLKKGWSKREISSIAGL